MPIGNTLKHSLLLAVCAASLFACSSAPDTRDTRQPAGVGFLVFGDTGYEYNFLARKEYDPAAEPRTVHCQGAGEMDIGLVARGKTSRHPPCTCSSARAATWRRAGWPRLQAPCSDTVARPSAPLPPCWEITSTPTAPPSAPTVSTMRTASKAVRAAFRQARRRSQGLHDLRRAGQPRLAHLARRRHGASAFPRADAPFLHGWHRLPRDAARRGRAGRIIRHRHRSAALGRHGARRQAHTGWYRNRDGRDRRAA